MEQFSFSFYFELANPKRRVGEMKGRWLSWIFNSGKSAAA